MASQSNRKDQQEIETVDDQKIENKSKSTSSTNSSASNSSSSTSSSGDTITPDPTNFEIKHPLQNKWGMWYDSPTPKKTLESWDTLKSHRKIIDFNTVEDFWCLFNNLVKPNDLANKSSYHLMKDGIEPEWESFRDGGHWVLDMNQQTQDIDKLWLWLVLAVIGESFDDSNEIVGCVVSIRAKGSRIELWTKRASDSITCQRIGRQLKSILELTNSKLPYCSFNDQLQGKKVWMYEV